MSRKIDLYAHILPEQFLQEAASRLPTGTLQSIHSAGASHFWDIEQRLADMDEYDIEKQVITLTQHDWPSLDPAEALPLVRLGNDEVRRIADEYPDRFVPVATLPYLSDAYLAEYERCIEALDMAGVQIFTNVDGQPVDAPEFRPLYERAAESDVPIWLHPQSNAWHEWTDEFALTKMLGWPFETSLAMARLVFSGIMQRHPSLTVVTHHNGGMVPSFAERIAAYYEKETGVGWVDLDQPVLSYFSRFYADTMLHNNRPALRCGLEFFDNDHVVFGTDYPFGPNEGRQYLELSEQSVEQLDLSPTVRQNVFYRNGEVLIQ